MKKLSIILILTGSIIGFIFPFILYADWEALEIESSFWEDIKCTWEGFGHIEGLGKMTVVIFTVFGGFIGWIVNLSVLSVKK